MAEEVFLPVSQVLLGKGWGEALRIQHVIFHLITPSQLVNQLLAFGCCRPFIYTIQVFEEEKLHACVELTNSKQKHLHYDFNLHFLDYQ